MAFVRISTTTRTANWFATTANWDDYTVSAEHEFIPSAANAVPVMTVVDLNPDTAYNATDLLCNATGTDAENTTIDFEYYWYKDTVLQTYGNATGKTNNTNEYLVTMSNVNTDVGEVWNCTVRVFDGTDYSASYKGDEVTISAAAAGGDDCANATTDTNPTWNYSKNCVLNGTASVGNVTKTGEGLFRIVGNISVEAVTLQCKCVQCCNTSVEGRWTIR